MKFVKKWGGRWGSNQKINFISKKVKGVSKMTPFTFFN